MNCTNLLFPFLAGIGPLMIILGIEISLMQDLCQNILAFLNKKEYARVDFFELINPLLFIGIPILLIVLDIFAGNKAHHFHGFKRHFWHTIPIFIDAFLIAIKVSIYLTLKEKDLDGDLIIKYSGMFMSIVGWKHIAVHFFDEQKFELKKRIIISKNTMHSFTVSQFKVTKSLLEKFKKDILFIENSIIYAANNITTSNFKNLTVKHTAVNYINHIMLCCAITVIIHNSSI